MRNAPKWMLVLVAFFIVALGNSSLVASDANEPADHRKLASADSGVISIDCGVNKNYTDSKTNFYYEADDTTFVESGKMYKVSSDHNFDTEEEQIGKQVNTLRSFPEGKRNCYTLKPKLGKNNYYLIRAYFAYGNYDDENSIPSFDLHLGTNYWTTVDLNGRNPIVRMEAFHVSPTDNIDVCLVNTGKGTPFISLLELWPLQNSMYQNTSRSLPLDLTRRRNLGMSEDVHIRYPGDVYGRSWFNKDISNSVPIKTTAAIENIGVRENTFKLPKEVLSTAVRSPNVSSSLHIDLNFNTSYEYYVYLHFFDFEEHSQSEQRKMNIAFTDAISTSLTVEYLKPFTIVQNIKQGNSGHITITSTSDSDLPAMINAYEIYTVLPQQNSITDEGDVDAIRSIKQFYDIIRINWQGDPCMPSDYTWEDLICNTDGIPRVTSLNLSSSKLTGEIAASFFNLAKLESLDLSNNQLTGEVPEFLAELLNLKLLNLTGNNLKGSIPRDLKEKSSTTLTLSLDGNPSLCQTGSCKSRTQKIIVPLVASAVAIIAVIIIIICIFVMLRRYKSEKQRVMFAASKKDGKLKPKNRAFSFSEVLSITNKFETVIGEGGFGKVYLGKLQDGTQVAVKLLSKSSQQGFKEFQSEAELLMIVHHRNLVSLVGYCDEGDMKALVYEYMSKGNLHHQLSDKNPNVLTWNERLRISLDAAYGLDYLHNGCKPPIVHRDLKTSNILLNENLQAKIADFGLSRAFANDIDTHISTRPAGTPGYLDPEFHSCGNLNRKSDVYSFGIILLELMTGQPAIRGTPDNISHIIPWVTPKLESGDIQSIIDPRLKGQFSNTAAWKFLEIAISCIPSAAIQRPDISQIVTELKECLALETTPERTESNSRISSTTLDISYQLESEMVPYVR